MFEGRLEIIREKRISNFREKKDAIWSTFTGSESGPSRYDIFIQKMHTLAKDLMNRGIDAKVLYFWHILSGSTVNGGSELTMSLDTDEGDVEKLANELLENS